MCRTSNACSWLLLAISVMLTATAFMYAWMVRCEHVAAMDDLRLMRQAIESAPIGIATADIDRNVTTYRNPALIAMTGWTVISLNAAGGPRANYIGEDQWDRLVTTVREKHIFHERVVLKKSNGKPLTVNLLVVPTGNNSTIIGFFIVGDEHGFEHSGRNGQSAGAAVSPIAAAR